MTYFEIEQAIRDCKREMFDPETGEFIGEEIDLAMLDGLEMQRESKIDNIISLFKEYAATAEAIKAEKMKLAKRQAQAEKNAERLKDFLSLILDGEKFQSPRNVASFRTAPDTVDITIDAEDLPKAYRKAEWKPVKKDILDALKSGKRVKGCTLITGRKSLIIK